MYRGYSFAILISNSGDLYAPEEPDKHSWHQTMEGIYDEFCSHITYPITFKGPSNWEDPLLKKCIWGCIMLYDISPNDSDDFDSDGNFIPPVSDYDSEEY